MDMAAPARPGGTASGPSSPDQGRWQPREPRTWEEAGLDPLLGEQLALRYFALSGTQSARQVANDLCLALPLVKELLEQLKSQKLLQHRGSTAMGDFIYEPTDAGRAKALDYKRLCAYVGPAPVTFAAYLQSVRDQTLRSRSPTPTDLRRAFEDLLVSDDLVQRLGPAITSGRALFLHGDPGNGKTSIAERITRCFGDEIWIPHALLIDGHLVKLYDPATHVAVDPNFKPLSPAERLDRRWVKIQRPTVVAGGELTLEMLEIQLNPSTNVCEAPLQLKANCGTLVIDDFGRQRIEPQILLNRWIFPLERRIDFLRLPDGRKITSPFDPLLIFSTNLEPRDLVDEAFLRRIPYKIEVQDPTEDEFRTLLEIVASKLDVILAEGAVDHLVAVHYEGAGRTFRFCHPRDLLLQVVNKAAYERRARVARAADFDHAVSNYFGAL
jgi:predicted ATPase with chaperone activity